MQQNMELVQNTELLGSTVQQIEALAQLFDVEYDDSKIFYKTVSIYCNKHVRVVDLA